MFCTETFAVGLNMPTKTVVFTGLKKYDDQTGGMRILRTDEYIQMAGRAGRRGKDTQGTVIYLPDSDPVTPAEMKSMMKGSRPPILSRMDFHYDFILKTLQSSKGAEEGNLKWLEIMERSYWFQQRQKEITRTEQELLVIDKKITEFSLEDVFLKGCEMREELEAKFKSSINASKKDAQRQLDILKSRQMGPKWLNAWASYQALKELKVKKTELVIYLDALKNHEHSIIPVINFLKETGYLKHADPHALKNSDRTLKGILATEINEGHQILMTELYIQELAHGASGDELVAILAAFQEGKETEDAPTVNDIDVPIKVKGVLKQVIEMAELSQKAEDKVGYPVEGYWNISLQMVEPLYKWIQGENASRICQDYGIFEGNFIRAIMKMANMLDEWLSLATYCQHVEQIDKITEVKQRLIRDIAVGDSLYLRL